MLKFKEFIKEEMVPYSGFVLARNQMPQIKNIDHFQNYVDQLGIETKLYTAKVYSFQPTQFEYDDKKVAKIIDEGITKAIIVSEDNFVLDGHHRYFAAKFANLEIPILKVLLPINKLLKISYTYVEQYD